MVEISSEIENLLIETTQCDNLEKALKFIFTDYLIMKIHLYSQKIIKFQDKWNMDFHKFKEKVHTQKDFHTYNYERDVWEWEEAMTLKNHYEGVKEKCTSLNL
ncbi:MAG: hypothetical protein H7A23_05140 [Leptospiraceae bacterium]|nr:hypothetical protein [Leptospiraceae bacterium]MCP5493920.1 hypothetical protein [Leptospiraceae bacterium]